MNKPLFLEGETGVGKTEVAKVLTHVLNSRLIRLQCYEGLDVNTAVYEWNYPRQILEIRLLESEAESRVRQNIFSEEFLLKRYAGSRSDRSIAWQAPCIRSSNVPDKITYAWPRFSNSLTYRA